MDHQGREVVENTNQLENVGSFFFRSRLFYTEPLFSFNRFILLSLSNIPGSDRKGRKGGKGRKGRERRGSIGLERVA